MTRSEGMTAGRAPYDAVRHQLGSVSVQEGAGRATWRASLSGLARHAAGVLLRPSPVAMRRIALAGGVASLAIIPTGAAVRLSQSGLGCTDWPKCTAGSLVASGASGDPLIHRWIEFGNRMITAAIFVIAIVVFIAAWRFRAGQDGKRRRDLVWLAAVQPAGIAAQALIGGIVVAHKLSPVWVSLPLLATVPVPAAAVAPPGPGTDG